MYSDWVGPFALGILTLWLGALSFFIWKQSKEEQQVVERAIRDE